jgi:putative ABC transport system ATP-binding protein
MNATIADSMSTDIILLEGVTKTYRMGDVDVHALDGVDLTISDGEYCAIMGPSGSGKSSAMNIIGCLDRPSTGHYYLDRLDVSTIDDDRLANVRNRKLGFVFQQFHLLQQLTAIENVMLPMLYAGIPAKERQERAAIALERVGLSQRTYNRPNQLSGGQQQRVAIARAIVNKPSVLLADEPTGALDSKTTQEVMDIFSELNETGITIVMVTHEPDVAKQTKRIVWFKDGKIVNSHLTPDDI